MCAGFKISCCGKLIWNRREIKRYELGLDLVLVWYKAGSVRLIAVLQLQRQICLLIAGLQFLFIAVRHVDPHSHCLNKIC